MKLYSKEEQFQGVKVQMIIIVVSIFIFFPTPLHAYMDPGTWSYIFSVLIAVFAGFIYYLRIIWEKVKELYNKMFIRKNTSDK